MGNTTKTPKNSIKSPAVGNAEAFSNLGGMPAKKSIDEIQKSLKPKSKIPGVGEPKSI